MKSTLSGKTKFIWIAMLIWSILFLSGCTNSGDDSNPFDNSGYINNLPANAEITTDSAIGYGAHNPTVIIRGSGFKHSIEDEDVLIDVGETGLTFGALICVSSTEIRIEFTGKALPGDITVQFKPRAFTIGKNISNILMMTVPSQTPVISSTDSIPFGAVNPSVLITGTDFAHDLGAADLYVDAGTTSLTLSTINYINSRQIRIAFTGTASPGTVKIQAKKSAFQPEAASASNTLKLTVPSLALGDRYGGGTVAYIFQSGDPGFVENEQHGLIVADPPGNESERSRLWHNAYVLSGVTATALGTGKTNTASIVALYPAEDNAARFCADFSVTEGTVTYDDWFLPSKDELYKLYETRVNYFEDGEYWSSSEIDATHAWGFVFSGFGWDIRIKNGIERVRPVRYF